MNWLSKVAVKAYTFWFGPVRAIRFRAFEIVFTFTFLAYFFIARFWYWKEWLTNEGYHYSKGATPSYLIDPFPLLEPWAALLLGVITGIAGLFLIAGKLKRPASVILFLVAVYIQNADALSSFALNIHYIVGFLVMAFSPGVIHGRDENSGRPAGFLFSAWPLRTLQLTFLLQIFTAGWCKVAMKEWIIHSDVLWSHVQGPYRNHLAAWMLAIVPMWLWSIMQWGALLFELVGPFLIAIRRTRWIGIFWAVGFTVFIGTTMNDLQYFAMQLASFLTLFLPVALLERVSFLVRQESDSRSSG